MRLQLPGPGRSELRRLAFRRWLWRSPWWVSLLIVYYGCLSIGLLGLYMPTTLAFVVYVGIALVIGYAAWILVRHEYRWKRCGRDKVCLKCRRADPDKFCRMCGGSYHRACEHEPVQLNGHLCPHCAGVAGSIFAGYMIGGPVVGLVGLASCSYLLSGSSSSGIERVFLAALAAPFVFCSAMCVFAMVLGITADFIERLNSSA